MLEEQKDEKRGFFSELWVRAGFLARRFGAWIVTRPRDAWRRYRRGFALVGGVLALLAMLLVGVTALAYGVQTLALAREQIDNPPLIIGAGPQGIYVPPSGRAPTGAFDAIKAAAGLGPGVSFYVNNHPDGPGDDSNSGLTWSTAFSTVQHALSVTLAGRDDTVWLAANGSARPYLVSGTNGLVIDKAQVDLRCAAYGNFSCQITNATGGAGSRVATIDANNVTIENITFINTSFVASGSTGVYVTPNADGSEAVNCLFGAIPIDDNRSALVIDAASFIVRGEASLRSFSTQASLAPGLNIGTGIILSGTGFIGFGETTIAGFEVGISVTNGAALALVDYNVKIVDVITGVYLAPGTFLTQIDASISALQANIQDESGNDTNRSDGSPTRIFNEVLHAGNPPFPGLMLYVDATEGKDTNTCRSEGTPCATFQAAFDKCTVGCGVVGEADTLYSEYVTITTNAATLFLSQGVIVSGTVKVTGDNVTISGGRFQSTGVALAIQGDNVALDGVEVAQATTAYSVTGDGAVLRDVRAGGYSVRGFDIAAQSIDIVGALAIGGGTDVQGFVFTGTQQSRIENASSIGNATAGFSMTATTANNLCNRCTNSSDSGDRVDLGERNMWAGWVDQMETEPHRHIYPISDGQGGAGSEVTVDQATEGATNLDYWGDTTIIAGAGALPGRTKILGLEFVGGAQTTNDLQWQMFFAQPSFSADRSGGPAWDATETRLETDGALDAREGDYLWVTSDAVSDGEIVTATVDVDAFGVITITTEVRASAGTGLRYNHGTAGAVVYLVWRETDDRFHPMDGSISLANRVKLETVFSEPRAVDSAIVIMRALNGTNGVNGPFGTRVIYE